MTEIRTQQNHFLLSDTLEDYSVLAIAVSVFG